MSYIDDVLGGIINEGKGLVRGYVNDALDPIGELLIDALQALGLLDSLESEWQKFEREELASYKGSFSPEELKSQYQDAMTELLNDYVADKPNLNTPWADDFGGRLKKFQDSQGLDANGVFSLGSEKPLPRVSLRPLWRHQVPAGASIETKEIVLMQRRKESEFLTEKLKGMTYQSRKFLENLNTSANILLSGRDEGYRHNHKLELMGKLDFSFPNSAFKHDKDPTAAGASDEIFVDGETFNVFPIPFFENPKISESRAATYAENSIINRNEPYKIWMGAKGKQVSLDFNISMTHLLTFATTQFNDIILKSVHSKVMRDVIMDNLRKQNIAKGLDDFGDTDGDFGGFGKNDFYNTRSESFYNVTNSILNDVNNNSGLGYNENRRAQIIVYTVYLLDMIRASVIGSTKWNPESPAYGKRLAHPPITFLTFGALYYQEPFIVKSYDITFDGKNGYEELSLLPRTINIKLKLESYDQLLNSQSYQGLSKRYQLGT